MHKHKWTDQGWTRNRLKYKRTWLSNKTGAYKIIHKEWHKKLTWITSQDTMENKTLERWRRNKIRRRDITLEQLHEYLQNPIMQKLNWTELYYKGQVSETFFQNVKYFLMFPHIPVYLGPDKNTIISVSQNCLASTDSLIEISKDKYLANTTTYLLKQQ